MMVLPVASAQLLARSFRGTLRWSVAIGVTSVVAGLAASRIWGLAPGGTIVLLAAGIFVVVGARSDARGCRGFRRGGGVVNADLQRAVELLGLPGDRAAIHAEAPGARECVGQGEQPRRRAGPRPGDARSLAELRRSEPRRPRAGGRGPPRDDAPGVRSLRARRGFSRSITITSYAAAAARSRTSRSPPASNARSSAASSTSRTGRASRRSATASTSTRTTCRNCG